MGIVERIEYDPNHSSRIAPVRWIEGVWVCQRKLNMIEEFATLRKILEPITTTIRGLFSFSSLPEKVDQRKVACFSPGLMAAYVVVGPPTRISPWSKSTLYSKGAGSEKTCANDVFFSALSSPKAKGETVSLSFGSSFGFPRVVVAGAKPAFFAPRMREKLRRKNTFSHCEVRNWRTHSFLWAHRIKHKAALSWQSFRQQDTLGLVGAAEHNESKSKTDQAKKGRVEGGSQLARAAGTVAKIMKEATLSTLSLKLVRLPYLPSGVEKLIDSRCRATIGLKTTGKHPEPEHVVKEAQWAGMLRPCLRGTVECRYHEREVQDTRPRNPGNHPPPMHRSLAHPGARHLAQLERPSLI
ncbi:hypothetical protein V6N12_028978 [Hibiscus sabdariffa]|uniref:Large ribosomal subunit protein uL2 C-terminal domain-containing protein n=1 Tax=Hibiscus sabdariffa TaxID=183260 RepID=A0ABR2F7D9_9ROSI